MRTLLVWLLRVLTGGVYAEVVIDTITVSIAGNTGEWSGGAGQIGDSAGRKPDSLGKKQGQRGGLACTRGLAQIRW